MKDRRVVISNSTDPYENLALEKRLMETLPEDTAILYLWQNAHTIVIGRNQDPFAECRTTEFLASGGKIARRYTGGGAVYHDLGNLNYTLIVPPSAFDIPRQMEMVCRSLALAGIPGASCSGRNDILVGERKCSGNAFQLTSRAGCHHGTLLLHTDGDMIPRYLTVNRSKLLKHGIVSVASRVMNLCEIKPELTPNLMKAALMQAFAEQYGPWEEMQPPLDEAWKKESAWLQSPEWIYPKEMAAPVTAEAHFAWGDVRLCLRIEKGRIEEAAIFTDALNAELFPRLSEALAGIRPEEAGERLALCFGDAHPEEKEIIRNLSNLLKNPPFSA